MRLESIFDSFLPSIEMRSTESTFVDRLRKNVISFFIFKIRKPKSRQGRHICRTIPSKELELRQERYRGIFFDTQFGPIPLLTELSHLFRSVFYKDSAPDGAGSTLFWAS